MTRVLTGYMAAGLVALSLSGCSIANDLFGSSDDSWQGSVAIGFEVESFQPCSQDVQWWLTGAEAFVELHTKYRDLGVKQYAPVYAKIKGRRSVKGKYGHLGLYEREFYVEEVIEFRPLTDGECTTN